MLLFFILSLMSKPMAVTLPVVLLILDYYPLERIKRQVAATKRSYRSGEQTEPCIRRCNNNNLTPPKNSSQKEKLLRCNSIKDTKRALIEKMPLFVLSGLSSAITLWHSRQPVQ